MRQVSLNAARDRRENHMRFCLLSQLLRKRRKRRMSGIRRRAVSGTIFTLLIVSIFTIPLNVQPARAESGIWIVNDDGPADFRTIQGAINAAYPGGESSTPTATVGTTTYVDSNVTKGTTYYYHVKAFDNQNPPNYSDPSNEASAAISPHIWPMLVKADPNSPGWQRTVVDNISPSGFYPSLAFDHNGNPAISYLSESGGGRLKYAQWDGTHWVYQIVPDEAGYYGAYSSLAFDSLGNPAISYYDATNKDLKYAYFNGTSWDIQTVAFASLLDTDTSLAFDSIGNPGIAYIYSDLSPRTSVKFARWNGISWDIGTVDSTGYGVPFAGGYLSLAFDPNGNPAISYYDATNKDLKYAYFNGTSWEIGIVDSEGDVGADNSLTFDPSGNPAISYFDWTQRKLQYAYRNGAQWNIEVIDSVGYLARYSSLAFDFNGKPAIAYSNAASGGELKFAYFNGSSWNIEIVDSPSRDASLAFDPLGNPAISYCNWAYAGSTLGYAIKNITEPPPPTLDFSISASSTSLSIQQGSSGSSTITITSINGFNQPVQLTISGAPPGVTATLDPQQVTPPPDGSTTSTLTVSVGTATTPGSYTLTVTGNSGAIAYSTYITLEITSAPPPPNKSPTASFTYSPQNPIVGEEVTFDASASVDPDGTIVSYQWSFGDGNSGLGKVATHAYSNTGTFTVTLTVTDNEGVTASTVETVNVSARGTSEWRFAVITDLHIGRSLNWPDYGAETPYDYDLLTGEAHDGNEGGFNCLTDRLQHVVNWMNANHEQENIKFLVILGDISDSAEMSEFFRAKRILDGLEIPYIPLIGNHDTWPKTEYFDTPIIKGDLLFEKIFWNPTDNSNLEKIESVFGDSWRRQEHTASPYLQNYVFNYNGINFIALDYARRDAASSMTMPLSETGETRQWLTDNLQQGKVNIIFSHFPPMLRGGFWYDSERAFNNIIDDSASDVLTFAGHIHAYRDENVVFTEDSRKVIVTSALMGEGTNFTRIVKVGGTGISDINYMDTQTYQSPRQRDPDVVDIQEIADLKALLNRKELWVASPVEPRVYDSSGQVTGLVGGELIAQIPNSAAFDDGIVIWSPIGSYSYELVGTAEGSYHLTVNSVNGQETVTFSATDIPTSSGAIHQYTIDWDTLSQNEEGVTLQIDSDGDGVFERIINTDATLQLFEISASPSSLTVIQGQATSCTIELLSLLGFEHPVTFEVSGLPPDSTATFEPSSTSGNATSTLTINTSPSTPAGPYNLTISGSSEGKTYNTFFTLNVAPSAAIPGYPWPSIVLGVIIGMILLTLKEHRSVARAQRTLSAVRRQVLLRSFCRADETQRVMR